MGGETAAFGDGASDDDMDAIRRREETGGRKPIRGLTKHVGSTSYNFVLNLFRWAVLGVILIFLLAAILALYEALNFQGRVLELTNNNSDRASRVLGVLYKTLDEPDRFSEDSELPFAAIAVRLDRLSRARQTLSEFNLPDDSSKALPVDGSADEKAPAKQESEEVIADQDGPGQQAGGSRAEAEAGADSVSFAKANGADGSPGQDLDAAAPNPADDDEATAPNDPKALLKAASQRLILSIVDLDDSVKASHPKRRLVDNFRKTSEGLKELRKFKGSIDVVEEEKRLLPGWKAFAAESDNDTTLEASRFELEQLTERLEASFIRVDRGVQTSPGDGLLVTHLAKLGDEIEQLKLFYKAEDLAFLEDITEKERDEFADLSVEDLIKRIDQRINNLQSVLQAVDSGFVAASKIAVLINDAREVAERIQKLPNEGVTHEPPKSTDLVVEGTPAMAKFDEVRGDLAKAIEALEQQLGERTRVMAVAGQLAELEEEGEHGRFSRAQAILHSFDSIDRFNGALRPLSGLSETKGLKMVSGFGFDSQRIATLSHGTLALTFVFVIGAIGSVIYITKDDIQHVLEGNRLTDPPKRSVIWHLFRPVFGVIVALAAFLLFKAGQLALGGNGGTDVDQSFNLPILSVIALFAGLLSWQALEAIETRGATWFHSQKRQPLWATGLDRKLLNEGRSREELASSIGRSVDQVFRWLAFRDRVTPEIQDRIADWLDVPFNQLFRSDQPNRKQLWLWVAKKSQGGIAQDVFEERLNSPSFPEDERASWLNSDAPAPVPPRYHDAILLAMDQPMSSVFIDKKPGEDDA